MDNIKLVSIEECHDEAYGASIVQYQAGNVISFAFSNLSTEEIKGSPSKVIAELEEGNKRIGEQPHWSALSPKLLEVVLANSFDMYFVEYEDEGWSEEIADEVFDEACKYELGITRGEDDCLLTVYAGTMGDINWHGHPEFGEPYLDETLSVFDVLKEIVENERQAFKGSYISGQFEPARVYEDWYMIGFYEAYSDLLTCDYFKEQHLEDEAAWLVSMDHPLGTLYDLWMGCDAAFSHDWDDMIDFIRVNYRESIDRAQPPTLDDKICAAESQNRRDENPGRDLTADIGR